MSSPTSLTPEYPPALCIMGPTASGKTQLAVELVKQYPFEIISVDSALVYRSLNIGSGKPSAQILVEAPHRLVDIRDPADSYSAADFRKDALAAMQEIHENGKTPLLVGGTMLYFKALRDGLAPMPAADSQVRQTIEKLALEIGWDGVHQKLAKVDPESAKRIHPNDPQRIQRALEVFEISGKSMTELHMANHAKVEELPFNMLYTAIFPNDRALLHQRIKIRFQQMLADGLVDEVRQLRARNDLNITLPAIRSVGYRQVWNYLNGDYTYDIMIEKSLAATRQLAKRQLTWLRNWPNLKVINSENNDIVSQYLKLIGSITI